MKTDRFSSASTRAAGVVLAGLLVAAGHADAGPFRLSVGGQTITVESSSKKLAKAVALQVGAVQKRFGASRRALPTVKDPQGTVAYPQQEVAGLIVRTGEDLDQALEKAQPGETEPLRAWAAEEIRRIQEELAALRVRNAALSSPRAVTVVASLGDRLPLLLAAAKPPAKAAPKPSAPTQETVPTDATDRLLDQVGEMVGRLFLLAKKEDLEVKLWVGSTPAPKATFRFWPRGIVKESAPAPTILQTAGRKDHVLRGLYSYRATWGKGAVLQVIEYPTPAGPSVAGMSSERLDLVKGSRFFCCQFDKSYCRHVDDEKDCR